MNAMQTMDMNVDDLTVGTQVVSFNYQNVYEITALNTRPEWSVVEVTLRNVESGTVSHKQFKKGLPVRVVK